LTGYLLALSERDDFFVQRRKEKACPGKNGPSGERGLDGTMPPQSRKREQRKTSNQGGSLKLLSFVTE